MTVWFPPQEKPQRWGSFQDVQYAIRENCEKIYKFDADDLIWNLPLFWGLPLIDFSNVHQKSVNHGATYKNKKFIFDGTNDHISNPTNFAYDLTEITIEIRVSIRNIGSYKCFIHKVLGWYIEAYGTGIIARIYPPSYLSSTGFTLTSNRLYQVVSSCDTATQYLHIDGTFNNSKSRTGDVEMYDNTYIGAWGGSSEWLQGDVDSLRVWKIPLNDEQINLFYERPFGLYQPIPRVSYSIPATPSGVIMPIFSQEGIHTNVFR